jgi:hypothetical protein
MQSEIILYKAQAFNRDPDLYTSVTDHNGVLSFSKFRNLLTFNDFQAIRAKWKNHELTPYPEA